MTGACFHHNLFSYLGIIAIALSLMQASALNMPTKNQAQVLRALLSVEVDQLYGLQDIGTARTWDCSLPTIGSHRSFTDRLNFKSDESFFSIFKDDVNKGLPYQILEDAGVFKVGNDLVLFGGCILDILLKKHDSIRDYDLRLVGEGYAKDEAKCVARAKEFVASIFSTILKENEMIDEQRKAAESEGRHHYAAKCNVQEIVVSRSRSTVTVHVPTFGDRRECVFQLTFAPKESVQHMLAACYPYCTRLAIKDGAVVLDHMARFSIESTAIVLDTSTLVNYYCGDADDEEEQARRVSSGRTVAGQFARYIKYYEKGFDIILPELDMSKVPTRNLEYDVVEVLALPGMIVVYDEVDKNLIMAERIDLPKKLKGKIPAGGLIGEYDSMPAPLVGEAIHHNIRCLVHDVYDSFKYVAQGERWDHVFNYVPSLTPRMVQKSYETVSEELRSGTVPIARLTGYFSVTPPDKVIEELIARPLRAEVCKRGTLPRPFVLDKDELKELTERETLSLAHKIEGLRTTLEGKGLATLISSFPENVSTKDEVFDAIYGANGVKNKEEDQ